MSFPTKHKLPFRNSTFSKMDHPPFTRGSFIECDRDRGSDAEMIRYGCSQRVDLDFCPDSTGPHPACRCPCRAYEQRGKVPHRRTEVLPHPMHRIREACFPGKVPWIPTYVNTVTSFGWPTFSRPSGRPWTGRWERVRARRCGWEFRDAVFRLCKVVKQQTPTDCSMVVLFFWRTWHNFSLFWTCHLAKHSILALSLMDSLQDEGGAVMVCRFMVPGW